MAISNEVIETGLYKELGFFNVKMLNGTIDYKQVYQDDKGDDYIKGSKGSYIEVYARKYDKDEYQYEQI